MANNYFAWQRNLNVTLLDSGKPCTRSRLKKVISKFEGLGNDVTSVDLLSFNLHERFAYMQTDTSIVLVSCKQPLPPQDVSLPPPR